MKVSLSSKVSVLRADVLSIVLGIVGAFFVLLTTLFAILSGETGVLVRFFQAIIPLYGPTILGLFVGFIGGFIGGYILGFIIGYVFNFLVKRKIEQEAAQEQILEFDPHKTVNIIKQGDTASPNPYTIVIVANPLIYLTTFKITEQTLAEVPAPVRSKLAGLKDREVRGRRQFLDLVKPLLSEEEYADNERTILDHALFFKEDETFEDDPIMVNKGLFLKVVTRCLKSFVSNELLSLPEIFSRLRIIMVFRDTQHRRVRENALCEELEEGSDILAPRREVIDRENGGEVNDVENYVRSVIEDSEYAETVKDIDLVFAVSASGRLTRSAARFTIDDESSESKPFEFTFRNGESDFDTRRHHTYPQRPGVAALSALDDRLKTPVHEFAHAMSSLKHGAIIDEYDDKSGESLEARVNKKFRGNPDEAIPKIFAAYKGPNSTTVQYYSDRHRRDKEQGWKSYTPERIVPADSCTMDVAVYQYRFDKLLFDFMYDRLITKLNRTPKT